MNLFFKKPVCSLSITRGKNFCIRLAMHLEPILLSQLRRVIGRQFFLRGLLLFFFFGIRAVINPLLWVTDRRPFLYGKMSALEVVDIKLALIKKKSRRLCISRFRLLQVKRFVYAFRKRQMSVRSKESTIYFLRGFFMCYGVPTFFVFLYI